MKTTVGEVRKIIEDVPDDFEVRFLIPCKIMHDFIEVEKKLVNTKVQAHRMLVVIETEILDLGPK